MEDPLHSPLLPFAPEAAREYGSIRLFASDAPAGLPFRYSRFVVEAGRSTHVDQHKVLEVWIVLSGEGRLLYDGREFAVRTGDAIQFDSLRPHQIVNDSTAELRIFSFWWSNE